MMCAKTGRKIGVIEHLHQSLGCLFTTAITERIQREGYGSLMPEAVDQPQTEALRLQIMALAIIAIAQWEPRLVVTKVLLDYPEKTRGVVTIEGQYQGRSVKIEGIYL